MMMLDFIKVHKKKIFYVACIAYFIYYSKTEGRFNDPYNRYIKEHGQSTIGEITRVERWKVGLGVRITYTVGGEKYRVWERYYDENLHTKFLKCSYDSLCIGEKYIVKYLPERPKKGAVCFDKPIQSVK